MVGAIAKLAVDGGPSRLLRDATDLIARHTDDAARSISNRVDRFADDVRSSGESRRDVDGTVAKIISRHGFEETDGYDDQGIGFKFRFDQVRSFPLVDHEGKVFGVCFPTKKGDKEKDIDSDEESLSAWARMPDRLGDVEYVPIKQVTSADGTPAWQDNGPSQTAPWADDADDGVLYMFAHAGPKGFRIEANVGTDADPDWKMLTVPGKSFGDVLATNPYFRTASQSLPGQPLKMIACTAGNPADAHSERVARVLHSYGMNHDVHATVGITGTRTQPDVNVAEIIVEVPDGAAPADMFTVTRAPRSP
jgi:hypothetical protein